MLEGAKRRSPIEQEKDHGPAGTMTPHSQPPEGGVSSSSVTPHSQPPELRDGESVCLTHVVHCGPTGSRTSEAPVLMELQVQR